MKRKQDKLVERGGQVTAGQKFLIGVVIGLFLAMIYSNAKATELEEQLEYISSIEELFNLQVGGIREDSIARAKDMECLVTALFFEARGEPELGQMWVYHVIENRVKSKYRGKETYCDVIYDNKQFSFANINPGVRPDERRHAKELAQVKKVVESLYGMDRYDPTCGATHYLNLDIATDLSWYRSALSGKDPENLRVVATIGKHTFLGPEQECL